MASILQFTPARRVHAIDTLGAGDTWHGALAFAGGDSHCHRCNSPPMLPARHAPALAAASGIPTRMRSMRFEQLFAAKAV